MNEVTNVAQAGGRRMTVLGVIVIILGMLALLAPGLAGRWVAMMLGCLMFVGGIVRLLCVFQAGSFGRGLFNFLVGVLTILVGVALVTKPLFDAKVLTLMLTIFFMLDGAFELIAGMKMQPKSGWLIFSGIVSLLLGLMLWSQYPLIGLWATGVLLGIKLFFVGLVLVTSGSAVCATAKA